MRTCVGMGAPTERLKSGITGQHVTLASLLILSVPLTICWSTVIAVLVVPVTLLTTLGFWHISRRVVEARQLVRYCILGGATAGAIDAILCYSFVTFVSHGPWVRVAVGFPSALLVGVLFGAGYGLVFLPPLLVQSSARGLRRSAAIDRCLVGCGAWSWAVAQIGLELPAAYQTRLSLEVLGVVHAAWGALAMVASLMLLVGVVPCVGRWYWLERVERGKVAGWSLVRGDDYRPGVLAGLPVFSKPLIPRIRSARVLVKVRTGDTYRGELSEPRYLVL